MDSRNDGINEKFSEIRKEIQALLLRTDDASIEETKYKVFIPREIDKSVTKSVKAAIYKIATLDFNVSLSILLNHFNELIAADNEKLADFLINNKEIRTKFLTITNENWGQLQSAIVDEKNKIKPEWERLIKGVQALINTAKNSQLPENVILLCKELLTWMEGLYLRITVNIRRKEIQDYISSTKDDMLLHTQHPLKERKITIPTGTKLALDKMGEMKEEELVPIILFSLEDILKKLPSDSSHKNTRNAILYYIKVFSDANETFYKKQLEKLAYLHETKDKIRPGLEQFVEITKDLEVADENFRQDYDFLKHLLEGYYLNAFLYQNTLFGSGANYLKNTMLRDVTKDQELSVIVIARYFFEAAMVLEEKLSSKKITENNNQVKIENPSSISDQRVSDQTALNDQHEIKPSTVIQEQINTKDQTISDQTALDDKHEIKPFTVIQEQINTNQTNTNQSNQNKLPLSSEENNNAVPSLSKEEAEFWQLLSQTVKSDTNKNKYNRKFNPKIDKLYNVVMGAGIPEKYKKQLLCLKRAMNMLFIEYESNTYLNSIPVVRNVVNTLDYVFPVVHLKYAFSRANADITMRYAKAIENVTDPNMLLKALINMDQDLTKRKSTELPPLIELLLEGAYDDLCAQCPIQLLQSESSFSYANNFPLTFYQPAKQKPLLLQEAKVEENNGIRPQNQ